jgi:hypothetical protein
MALLWATVREAEEARARRARAEGLEDAIGYQYRLAYPRAAALTILRQNDAAMTMLEESFDRGYRKRWCVRLSSGPVFRPLRSDPGFEPSR